MNKAPDKNRILSALEFEWNAILDLCKELNDSEWETPTDCPGWSVKDNVSHILGTELMLSGTPMPDVEIADASRLKNDIAKMNERWVQERRSRAGAEVLAEYESVTKTRMSFLHGLSSEAWEDEAMTPIGPAPFGRFMQIRVLDSWIHEQDIRTAIGKPGNDDGTTPIDVTLDEIENALGFVVGKRGGAPDGVKVQFEVTGKSARNIFVEMAEGRGNITDGSGGPADVKLTASAAVFGRLFGGRKDGQSILSSGDLSIETQEGHEELAQNILNNLGYMV